MTTKLRGADILARSLSGGGINKIFALSGNHIMPVFDAALDAGLELIHVRHEAAAVHMADAWARLTGEVGIALVTGGPGHANGVSALYTALASESPVVLLSGHAPLNELGLGAFQEMRQADLAAPVVKYSFTAATAQTVGHDLARAVRTAKAGRPGPVHLSLPVDVLESIVEEGAKAVPLPEDFSAAGTVLGSAASDAVLAQLSKAAKPIILAGPAMMRGVGHALLKELAAATRVPVIGMESPRGVNDPSLGAFAEVLARADLIVLLGKMLDFTLKFGRPPTVDAGCRFIHIDPDPEAIQRTSRAMGDNKRLILSASANSLPTVERLLQLSSKIKRFANGWFDEVQAAVQYRPSEWANLKSPREGPVHAVELCRFIQQVLNRDKNSVFVSDGGEFGQWAQSCLSAPHRVINGVAGSIGSAVPFALAARLAFPNGQIVALTGDGAFGFHMAEFDTAVRYNLPFVAVVGNDACWNAEYQIQLRTYGPDRRVGCELLPTRYDLVVGALGGLGENVTKASEVPAALDRALRSGRPTCVNVSLARLPAPNLRRPVVEEADTSAD